METSIETKNITKALIDAQEDFPLIPFDAENTFFHSKYATLGSVIKATKPILRQYGLAIFQSATNDGDRIGVTTRLLHESGEWFQDTVTVPIAPEDSDSKPESRDRRPEGDFKKKKKANIIQEAGKNITYLRRYSYTAMLNLYSEEDTDGGMNDGYEQPPKHIQPKKEVKAKAKAKKEEKVDPIEELMAEFEHKWNLARGLGNPENELPKISAEPSEKEMIEAIAELNILLKESE